MRKETFDRNVLNTQSKFMWRNMSWFKGYYENPGNRGFRVKNDNNFWISKQMKFSRRIVWLIKKGPVVVKI